MANRRCLAALGVLVLCLTAGCAGAVGPSINRIPADPVLNDFQHRVSQYVELHSELHQGIPPKKESSDVGANLAARDSLAARIRVARTGARQGDIFTPPIAAGYGSC